MRSTLIALWASLLVCSIAIAAGAAEHSPQLLLTPQRLRRLQRDRERRTVRWVDFENRVLSVPNSPERGFELALYYAVTHDEGRGREAIKWARAHWCESRQTALVLDWVADLITEKDARPTSITGCVVDYPSVTPGLRDALFTQVALGGDPPQLSSAEVLKDLQQREMFRVPQVLYAACEYLDAVRTTQHADLREDAPQFFSGLPTEILLGLKPEQVEHPDWMTHVAALALVSLDPNLEGSQYLQGWAIEDRQMIREGRGVAYELLWGDPYLPGIGYQNLDPWMYDPEGRLFARSNWNQDACWIAVSGQGIDEQNCPPGWEKTAATFGHMTLMPAAAGRCTQIPARKTNEVAIVWKLQPRERVTYSEQKRRESAQADAAGMWRVPGNVEGKVCAGQ